MTDAQRMFAIPIPVLALATVWVSIIRALAQSRYSPAPTELPRRRPICLASLCRQGKDLETHAPDAFIAKESLSSEVWLHGNRANS